MRSISLRLALLTAVLLTACAIDNPTSIALPDAGPCGTMGAACCPQVAAMPGAARTVCRTAGTTCSAGSCVACGAPGQPCCAGAVAGDGGTSMDAGAGGSCTGNGVTCLSNMCVDCSGPDRAVCNGVCVSLTTDQNCGACGTACVTTSGERCVRPAASGVDGGVTDAGRIGDGGARVAFCQIQCPPGQVLCGNTCRDLTTDPNNCRTCGNQCNVPGAVAACTASVCTLATCRDGFGNCDGNAANGCEATTSADVMNCGVCGNRCSFANAAATCAAGICMRGACNPGFADCDGNPANGCEVNTAMGDIANCGTCGARCTAPTGATPLCVGSMCRISTVVCSVGLGNCDGVDGNGCETTTLNNIMNCGLGGTGGGCGNACPSTGGAPSCAGGVCSIACNPGLGDCDSMRSNGCETNITNSVAHCGGCGRVCALPNVATQTCAANTCTVAAGAGSCVTGFGNCDSSTSNGCETNLNVDGSNCGACGRVCLAGQTCQAGTCTTICAAGTTGCTVGGVTTCRDLATDNTNCGACGTTCTGGTSCQGRVCTCPTGQTVCSGTCRALQTDNANCGTCGNVCASGTVCSAGACTSTCAAGTTPCTSAGTTTCQDLQTSAANCGACGTVCARANGVAGCRSGGCFLAACNAGFANCDGNDANGCEVNTATTTTNCGACGNSCQFANAGATCSAGRCVMGACTTGFRDCNSNPVDGCEVNTVSGNTLNCGACGTTCPTPPVGSIAVCSASTCGTSSVSCSAGTADCDGAPGNGCEVNITTTSNCGACGRACVGTNGTATCTSGLCGISCGAGFGNCNGLLSDGCETNTTNSPTNCGGCNTVCSLANATAGCTAGACTIASCNAGFANCDGIAANGCEVNLNSDNANCGACSTGGASRACVSPQLCSAGVCVTSCGTGQTNCSSVCRNLTNDPDACGGCSTVCSGTGIVSRTCGSSLCNGTCSSGRANCDGDLQTNGCEVDINTSATQCGGCTGSACSTNNITAACSGGTCTGMCGVGFADCDADKRTNGCEINTTNNVSNCGGCGASFACPARTNATATCVGGACSFTCTGTFRNCDGTASNGCESDSQTDVDHCGGAACGSACPTRAHATRTCAAGTCGFTCDANFADCNMTASDGCEADLRTDTSCGSCAVTCPGMGNVCTLVGSAYICQ